MTFRNTTGLVYVIFVKHNRGRQTKTEHYLKFSFSWVLAQWSHNCAQLLCGDSSVTILVEKRESFLEFCDLFFCQLENVLKV